MIQGQDFGFRPRLMKAAKTKGRSAWKRKRGTTSRMNPHSTRLILIGTAAAKVKNKAIALFWNAAFPKT